MAGNPQFASEQSAAGEFVRQEDAFRAWISADGSTPYPAAADRYHLYVSLACPWASRTVIHDAINPTRIVPLGPLLDLTTPHGREKLSA